MNAREIFMNAPEGATPDALAAYLDSACGGNQKLRQEAEALFAADELAGETFLEVAPVQFSNNPDASGQSLTGEFESIEGYKILQEIGEGGFGVVYMADQLEPVKRRVAIKIIKPGMDTRQVVARFEVERQALAMMDHPNISRVFDAGTATSGRPYFVMELVKGVPITKFCDEARLDTEERLQLFVDVCSAVQHAHQKGIIHRDIKPSNVLVTMHDNKPVPKIIDFGVAKAMQGNLTDKTLFTAYAQFIGTPAYMSPEQAQMSALDIDTRSDIYGLGVLLYELLTGCLPFDPKKLAVAGQDEMRRQIREIEPERPSTRLSTMNDATRISLAGFRRSEPRKLQALLRGDLDWIVMKALEKDRNRRYDTANGLAADVKRAIADEAVEAGPPSVVYRARKTIRRHRAALSIAAVIAIILVAATVISMKERGKAVAAKGVADEEKIRVTTLSEALAEQLEETDAANSSLEEKVEEIRESRDNTELQKQIISFTLADQLLAAGEAGDGVALLAKLARENSDRPIGRVAAERMISALQYKSFPTPALRPLRGNSFRGVRGAVSPDGTHTVLTWLNRGEHPIKIWDLITNEAKEIAKFDAFPWWFEFSPDGSKFVVCGVSDVGIARVYEAPSGKPVGQIIQEDDSIPFARFSPDGMKLLTCSDAGMARIWSFNHALQKWEMGKALEHDMHVTTGDWSPDGRMIATGGLDKKVRVWNSATESAISDPLEHKYIVWKVRFSPDNRTVAAGCGDGTVALWEVHTGDRTAVMKHRRRIGALGFNSTGSMLATGSHDGTARVWNTDSGYPVTDGLQHDAKVDLVEFSPDDSSIATGSHDGTARLWRVPSGMPLEPVYTQNNRVTALAFHPNGKQLFTAGGDSAQWWRLQSYRPRSLTFHHAYNHGRIEDGGRIHTMQFSPDESRIVSAGKDSKVRFWDAMNGNPARGNFLHSTIGSRAVMSPDGRLTVTWLDHPPYTMAMLDTSNYSALWSNESRGAALRAAWSPDSRWLAIGYSSNQVHQVNVHNPLTGDLVHSFSTPDVVWGIEFNPAEKPNEILVSNADGSSQVFDIEQRKELSYLPGGPGYKSDYHSKYSPDGKLVSTIRSDDTVVIRDPLSGESRGPTLRHSLRIYDTDFSPDQQLLATASVDRSARLWNLKTGDPVGLPMLHGGPVRCVRFSPDGARVATSSKDGTVRIWDSTFGLPLSEPLPHWHQIDDIAFSKDGRRLIASDLNAKIRLWELPPLIEDVPSWLCDWAEAVAGKRAGAAGTFERIGWHEAADVVARSRALQVDESGYGKVLTWFYQDAETRAISPFSK